MSKTMKNSMLKLLPFMAMAALLPKEKIKTKEEIETELKFLVKEFNLIQQKKSNLSFSKRDIIEKKVNILVEKGILKFEKNENENKN